MVGSSIALIAMRTGCDLQSPTISVKYFSFHPSRVAKSGCASNPKVNQ